MFFERGYLPWFSLFSNIQRFCCLCTSVPFICLQYVWHCVYFIFCSKFAASFQSMEVRNSSFAAFIDVFTSNTYVMVIMSDPSIRKFTDVLCLYLFIFTLQYCCSLCESQQLVQDAALWVIWRSEAKLQKKKRCLLWCLEIRAHYFVLMIVWKWKSWSVAHDFFVVGFLLLGRICHKMGYVLLGIIQKVASNWFSSDIIYGIWR